MGVGRGGGGGVEGESCYLDIFVSRIVDGVNGGVWNVLIEKGFTRNFMFKIMSFYKDWERIP